MADPVYRGISFPFRKGKTAFPEPATDDDLIRESLIQIVLTPKRSRVMRPDFGTNVLNYVFESNNSLMGAMIRNDISAAITRFEPRVVLNGISVTRRDNEVIMTVAYTVRATNEKSRFNISVPGA